MSSYQKGAEGENELGNLFGERGFVWLREAGSGTADRELPDILVGKDGYSIAIEVKRWGNQDYDYVSKKEVEDLKYFSKNFGADEYYIAFRFNRKDWNFAKEDELHETEKNYRCERDLSGRSLSEVCNKC